MIIKGRRPTIRHVSRTHRVALDWLFDRINLDPKIENQINCHQKPTNSQTWGINFTRDEWKHLTLAISVVQSVLKWCQKERKKMQVKKRVTAKSKPMMNLVSRCSVRDPTVLASTASESPVKTRNESQIPLRP